MKRHPIRTLLYRIRVNSEIGYFYKRRVINKYWYDSEEEKWQPQEKRFYDHASEVIGNWYDGEWAVLNMIKLKLDHIYYKTRKDGNHAYWYIDTFRGMIDENKELLFQKGFIDRFIGITRKERKRYWNNELGLEQKDGVDYSLVVKYEKGNEISVTLNTYDICKEPVKKPVAYEMTFDNYEKRKALVSERKELKKQYDSFNGDETKTVVREEIKKKIDALTKEIDSIHLLDDHKPILEKTVYKLKSRDWIGAIKFEKLPKSLAKKYDNDLDFGGEKYKFYESLTPEINNIAERVQAKLNEFGLDVNFYDEALNSMQTVGICPSIYVQLSDGLKKKCRGRRNDLHTVFTARRKLFNIMKLSDGDDKYRLWEDVSRKQFNTEEEYEEATTKAMEESKRLYNEDRRKAYADFAEYMADNFESVWD